MGLLDEAIREHLDLKRRRGADPAEIERAEREALGPVRREPVSAIAMDPAGVLSEPVFSGEPRHADQLESPEPPRPHKRRGLFGRSRHEPENEHRGDSLPEQHRDPGLDDAIERALRTSGDEPPYHFAEDDESDLPPTSVYERPREPEIGAPLGPADPRHDDGASLTRREPAHRELDEQSPNIPPPVGATESPVPPAADMSVDTAEFDVEGSATGSSEDHFDKPSEAGDVLEETPEFLQDTPDHDRLWFEQRPPRDFDFDG